MMFVPPQVLNKSLLNKSISDSPNKSQNGSSLNKSISKSQPDEACNEPSISKPIYESSPIKPPDGKPNIKPFGRVSSLIASHDSDGSIDDKSNGETYSNKIVNNFPELKVEEPAIPIQNPWSGIGDELPEDEDSDSDCDPKDVIYQDMELFFHAIGEPQLIELFLKNKVRLGQLLEFDEQDLINCGVELVGDRKKILANTGQMHCEKWMPSSLQDLTTKSLLSSPGIYMALNDINKHVEYIGVTLKYLRRRVQSKPEILELGKDFVGVTKVSSELDNLILTIKSTQGQASALRRQVGKHLTDPLLKPANHIDEQYIKLSSLKRRFIAPILVMATVVVFVSIKLTRKLI